MATERTTNNSGRVNRMFRVFVSSTFCDMKLERDALQARVFSRLRELCAGHGYRFQAIDLRWGVHEEAALDQRTMRICVEEIRRCRAISPMPNFLVLLGDRYGWRPLRSEIPDGDHRTIIEFVKANREELDREVKELGFRLWEAITAKLRREGGTISESVPAGALELIERWYRVDENAMAAERDGDPAGSGTVWVLQPRTGSNSIYADPDIWAIIETGLSSIIRRATAELPAGKRLFYNISATAQEIVEGVFRDVEDARKHVFCFIRNIEGRPPDAGSAAAYFDAGEGGGTDAEAAAMQAALKKSLAKAMPDNVYGYSARLEDEGISADHLDAMCLDAYSALSKVILEQISREREAGPLEREIAIHADFRDDRMADFAGRAEYVEIMRSYLGGDGDGGEGGPARNAALILRGGGGSGKTSLMARAAALSGEMADETKRRVTVFRFLGITPASSGLRPLLEGLTAEIREKCRMAPAPDAQDAGELVRAFAGTLDSVPDDAILTVILDSLDQLSLDDNVCGLRWIPEKLRPNVRFIVSVLDEGRRSADPPPAAGRFLGPLSGMVPAGNMIELRKMPGNEGGKLLDGWLDGAGRRLTKWQRDHVLRMFESDGNPLYLKLAFEEARRWRSYDGPEACALGADIEGIIDGLFTRLSRDTEHGEMTVSRAIGFIAASRNGLSEDELLDLLAMDGEYYEYLSRSARHEIPPAANGRGRIPITIWSRLFFDIIPYLTERTFDGTLLMNFFHRHFAMAARKRYLSGADGARRHAMLAGYFMGQPLFVEKENGKRAVNSRKCSETIYQLRMAGMYPEIENHLTDLDFIEAKCMAGMTHDLVMDYESSGAGRRMQRTTAASESREQIRFTPAIHEFSDFVRSCAHILVRDPAMVYQLAANDPDGLPQTKQALLRMGGRKYMKKLNKAAARSNCLATLAGHASRAGCCAISPDGSFVVSGSDDRTLRIWDARTGIEIRALSGHSRPVTRCAVSLDGISAVSASREENRLRIWDIRTGRETASMPLQRSLAGSCAISACARYFASAGYYDTCIKVCLTGGGKEVASLDGHTGGITALAVSLDGSLFVTSSEDGTVKIWDARTGREKRTLFGHTGPVTCCAISPDGAFVVSSSSDSKLKIWDASGGMEKATLSGHQGPVTWCAISPNGAFVVSSSEDRTIRIWDARTGAPAGSFEGHSAAALCCAVFPDSMTIASSSEDRTVRIWDARSPAKNEDSEKRSEAYRTCAVSADGNAILTVSAGGRMSVHDPATGRISKVIEDYDGDAIFTVSADGSLAVSITAANEIGIWRISKEGRTARAGGHEKRITAFALSRDLSTLVTASADGVVKIRDAFSGAEKRSVSGHSSMIGACDASGDGKRIVTASYDRTLKIWDAGTSKLSCTLAGHENAIKSCAFTPDGSMVVSTAEFDYSLRVWSAADGRLLHTLSGHRSLISSFAFIRDGAILVSASWDGDLRAWDLRNGHNTGILRGHTDIVKFCAPFGHGTRVMSASEDGTVRIWDVSSCEMVWQYHAGGSVNCLSADAAGRRIAAIDEGGGLHLIEPVNL